MLENKDLKNELNKVNKAMKTAGIEWAAAMDRKDYNMANCFATAYVNLRKQKNYLNKQLNPNGLN